MRVNWSLVRDAIVALAASAVVAGLITNRVGTSREITVQLAPSTTFQLAPGATRNWYWEFIQPTQVPDPDNVGEYYRLKSHGPDLEGLLHCRVTLVERCEWVSRYL